MSGGISFAEIEDVTGPRIGTFDTPCPLCGPDRRARGTHRRRVLRVWRINRGFATYHCARCGVQGCARDVSAAWHDRVTLARLRAEPATRHPDAEARPVPPAHHLCRVAH